MAEVKKEETDNERNYRLIRDRLTATGVEYRLCDVIAKILANPEEEVKALRDAEDEANKPR